MGTNAICRVGRRFTWAAMAVLLPLVAAGGSAAASAASTPRPEQPGGLGDKPYLAQAGQSALLGGYMDMEFEWKEDGSTFDQHRFVPFITGHVSERVTVSAEIEFEHGGNPGEGGEIKLEYAVMDFELSEAVKFRGGVLLSPLGSFNLLHDTPLNDLTERPTVSRQLMPSTLSEAGLGFFGTLYPGEASVFSYEAYLVNGFNEGILSGTPGSRKLRVRGGRGSQEADNNDNKAVVARAGFSPALGATFGVSVHTGKYDNAGEHRLTIGALDGKWTSGALELQGEAAVVNADIDRTAEPNAAGRQSGVYGQANYHLLHDAVLAGSVFTAVVRGDWVDYDTDQAGDTEEGLTLGLNFRPTEETVFKLDYNWTWLTPVSGSRGEADGRLYFSFATYF